MAVKNHTEDVLRIQGVASVFTWDAMANGDSGEPIERPDAADRTIHFTGTFDTTTVVWEGSNDGLTYVTLTDPQGNAISKNVESIEQVTEVTRYMRPRVTAGGGSTAIVPVLLIKADR
jgi:hypothetical protein